MSKQGGSVVSVLVLAVVLVAPALAGRPRPTPCTDGVDCFCDLLEDDPAGLVCDDNEHPSYYRRSESDDYAASNGTNRGSESRYIQDHGGIAQGSAFQNGEPVDPYLGPTCDVATPFGCTGIYEYCSEAQGNLVESIGEDCWGPGTNEQARMDMQRALDYKAEITDLTLEGGNSPGGVFAGRTHMAYRVDTDDTGGFVGGHFFPLQTEFGVTQALGYASNLDEVGIFVGGAGQGQWKHDEWGQATADDHWTTGMTGSGPTSIWPYSPIMFLAAGIDAPECSAALAAATVSVGSADCTDVALRMGADPALFDQEDDFPWGTWRCPQAHVKNMGTTNMEIRLWHDSKLIFEITGLDSSILHNGEGFSSVGHNAYANVNEPGGAPDTTEVTFRYQDNFYVRAGLPISCGLAQFSGMPECADGVDNDQDGDVDYGGPDPDSSCTSFDGADEG